MSKGICTIWELIETFIGPYKSKKRPSDYVNKKLNETDGFIMCHSCKGILGIECLRMASYTDIWEKNRDQIVTIENWDKKNKTLKIKNK